MVARPIRARVGRSRLSSGVSPSEARYTRIIRQQMQAIEDNFARVIKNIESVTPDALVYALEPAFKRSQDLVPVSTGALKASGYLESRKFRGRAVVEIGYARSGRPKYSVFVHENLEAFHVSPTQAKFLERALQETGNQVAPRIASYIRRNAF